MTMPFPNLDIYISNGRLNTKIYDQTDGFSFPINVNCPFKDGDVPSSSYGVYIYISLFDLLVHVTAYLIVSKEISV